MDFLKIVFPTVLTFFIGLSITPVFTRYFYRYKMWKKHPRTSSGDITSDHFAKHHNAEQELSTPRIGGVIVWVAVLFSVIVIYFLSTVYPGVITEKMNFFSRSQTLVPLGVFFLAALIGLADDMLHIMGQGSYGRDSIGYRKIKIIFVTLMALAIGFWFYYKLDFVSISVPFDGDLYLGILFIPFFVFVMLATFSTSVIDGFDGLAGGVLASAFTSFAVIAFIGNQIDIAALSGAIAGGILAFLWFNVPPARFYMGETGMLALTIVLAVIAFLTDSVLLLPVIAFPLAVTGASSFIQIYYYKLFKKRVFKVAPLHHHFEALGWSREKIVMRYWIVSVICAITGVILFLVS